MMKLFNLDAPLPAINLNHVLMAIRTVRIGRAGLAETEIHDSICMALATHCIPHKREQAFGPRCRADIWVNGIVIEIKKQRPARAALLDQISRYADQPTVRAIVIVLERSVPLPATLNDKPITVISLNALWGIAL